MSTFYIAAFNNSVKEEIKRQSRDGRIKVDFNRLIFHTRVFRHGISGIPRRKSSVLQKKGR